MRESEKRMKTRIQCASHSSIGQRRMTKMTKLRSQKIYYFPTCLKQAAKLDEKRLKLVL